MNSVKTFLQSTDPLGVAAPNGYKSWSDSVLPFYENHQILFAVIASLYLPIVFQLKDVMESLYPGNPRENKELQKLDKNVLKLPLVLWNFGLAFFSMWGAYHLVPHVLQRLDSRSYQDVVCDTACYNHPVAMVVLYFNISKMPEFIDTIFLRLRRRPVIFLHWYHHIVTMLYCWYANQIGIQFNCTGMFFAAMNLSVHSVMYVYYGVAALGYARNMAKLNLNIILTTGQIIQMVGGILILVKSTECTKFDSTGFTIATIMYSSYFLLFSRLFYTKYCGEKKKTDKKQIKPQGEENSNKVKKVTHASNPISKGSAAKDKDLHQTNKKKQ